MDATDVHQL